MIEVRSLSYTYPDSTRPALRSVSLDIGDGEYLALAGANGSGKSTLIRCLNGLLLPPAGAVRVDGLDPSEPGDRRRIRRSLALVFQSPPDQIVASVVEEDAAFGLENLAVPRPEMVERVEAVLAGMGLLAERTRPTRFLSAGQQQRLAVAGAVILRPRYIVFDEATSMIDPAGRKDILDRMDALAASGATVIHVTHDMEEAARARRVVVLSEGGVAFDGTPESLFRRENPASLGLAAPRSWNLALALGLEPRAGEGAEELGRRLAAAFSGGRAPGNAPRDRLPAAADKGASGRPPSAGDSASGDSGASAAFRLEAAGLRYLAGTPHEKVALDGVSIEIPRGALVALVGETGSGKSSLLQLLDALAFPSSGRVFSFGADTSDPRADVRALRMRSPLAVQRPESALFEYYAGDEVSFGPRNQGVAGPALVDRARKALDSVGLPFGEFRDRPTRSLSGGQKRRLALASVLSMDPEALLLDEPGSALDPVSRSVLMELVYSYARRGRTVVFATHSMEEAARADLVVVLAEGGIRAAGAPGEIFGTAWDPGWGLIRPFGARAAAAARRAGLGLSEDVVDEEGLAAALAPALPRPRVSAEMRPCPERGESA